jgi:hypothetical protein
LLIEDYHLSVFNTCATAAFVVYSPYGRAVVSIGRSSQIAAPADAAARPTLAQHN